MTTTDTVSTNQSYHDETLEEFKASSYDFVKDLTQRELIDNLRASVWQCGIRIDATALKIKRFKDDVYPFSAYPLEIEKAQIPFFESYLHVLTVFLENAQAWLRELKIEVTE
jgi:hypothetical protein